MPKKNYAGLNTTLIHNLRRKVDELKETNKKISLRLEFERTLSDISSRFISLKDIDKSINNALEDMGGLSRAGRAYIFIFDKGERTMSNVHEWHSKGVSPQIRNLQNLPISLFPWWIKKLRKGEIINIQSVSELPKEADAEKKILQDQDIKSVLVLPLYIKDSLIGFLGLDNVKNTKKWKDEDVSLLSLVSDIFSNALERKQNEQDIKESEQRLQAIFDSAKDAIAVLDRKGRILKLNKSTEDICGYTEKELLGKSLPELKMFPRESRDKIIRGFRRRTRGYKWDYVVEMITKNNKKRLIEISAAPYKTGNKIIGTVAILKDITEKQEAERRIRESEEKYRNLFENANDAIFIADLRTGKIIDANKQASKLLKRPLKEIIGMHQTKLHPSGKARLYAEKFRKHIRKRHAADFEAEIVTKTGKKVPVYISANVMNIKGKEVIQGVFKDISGLKK